MKWIPLETEQQLTEIKDTPGYSVIFKHSTRCSISMMARRKFEMDWDRMPEHVPLYFLDLLKFRDVSNQVTQDFHVHHESPQLLLIKEGECILDQSHGGISVDDTLLMLQ